MIKKEWLKTVNPYFYVLPAFIFLTFLTLLPNIYSLYISFTNYSFPYHYEKFNFIGIANYLDIFKGEEFRVFVSIFFWTVLWAVCSVGFQLIIGLALALFLNQKGFCGQKIYRTLFIIPWAIPSFISVLMWGGLLNTSHGSINYLLHQYLGLSPIPWLDEPFWARVSVILVNLWLGFPFMMSIALGALQSIPQELYEAASVDGANKVQAFRFITLPMLRAAMLPVIISSFAFNFNNFTGIYLLTAGGPPVPGGPSAATPAGATDILVSYTYKLAFGQANTAFYGLACAYAVIIFLLIATLSALNFKLTGAFKEL